MQQTKQNTWRTSSTNFKVITNLWILFPDERTALWSCLVMDVYGIPAAGGGGSIKDGKRDSANLVRLHYLGGIHNKSL